jgi:hypothetical protein
VRLFLLSAGGRTYAARVDYYLNPAVPDGLGFSQAKRFYSGVVQFKVLI